MRVNVKKALKRKLPAYTLTEILIVLCIIAVLTMIAVPRMMPLVTKAKTTEARLQLEHVNMLENEYFYEHSKYTTDLKEIGYVQENLSTESKDGRANYRIEVTSVTGTGFVAKATSVVDFNGNGVFNVWQVDQDKNIREVTPD